MRTGARHGGTWRLVMWGAIATLLLLPLVAMQLTDEVAWDAADFAAAAALLVGAGAIFEAVARSRRLQAHRLLIGAGLIAAVALAWVQGAVGIL